MAEYIEYHPLKFWLDPASIAEIVAHIQTYLVNNPINSTTEIETIIHDYLIAHPELIGGVDSVNGETGEVILTADNISAGETVTIADVLDSLQDQINDVILILNDNPLTGLVNVNKSINYPIQSPYGIYPRAIRVFWSETVPSKATIKRVFTHVINVGSNRSITFEIWEKENDILTIAERKTITEISSNSDIECEFNNYSDKERMISYISSNINALIYMPNQPGYSWKYLQDVTLVDSIDITNLMTYNNMKLVGGFVYSEQDKMMRDFYSGILDGNICVFGDSTVDGASVTDHNPNTIGVDRDAQSEPNVFTSILENMIRTFTGSQTKRVYNAGFGGKTLNYIADNYSNIMSAFDNVKSAIIVIDVNSASGTREEYINGIKTGITRLFNLLREDGISFAVMSPQPMFYYPSEGELPAINSAGEYYIGVNIAKDLCNQYNVPFIDVAKHTNYMIDSPYLNSQYFLGDRIHFGDNGHRVEAYEIFGELIHPILYFDGNETYIGLQSNKGELSSDSGISANFVGGYQSIVLSASNTRTDVLHRIYVLAKSPFTIKGIEISGWTSYYDVFVDDVLYTSNTINKGDTINAGWHEITIKPTAINHVVRYSGLIFEKP